MLQAVDAQTFFFAQAEIGQLIQDRELRDGEISSLRNTMDQLTSANQQLHEQVSVLLAERAPPSKRGTHPHHRVSSSDARARASPTSARGRSSPRHDSTLSNSASEISFVASRSSSAGRVRGVSPQPMRHGIASYEDKVGRRALAQSYRAPSPRRAARLPDDYMPAEKRIADCRLGVGLGTLSLSKQKITSIHGLGQQRDLQVVARR